MRGYT